MRLHFHGAVKNVTGTRHIVETDGRLILLDCGMIQGSRAEANEKNRTLPFEPAKINAVVLSHAHIDHSGSLPVLVRGGFRGHIFTHPATADLCDIMLRDAAHIQEQDAEFLNRKLKKHHKPLIEPIYTQKEAAAVGPRFANVEYGKPFEPVPGVKATLRDAGHILGSATVTLELKGKVIIFSGDLGRPGMPILRDPERLPEADVLITECTYGDRLHESAADMKSRLREVIARTLSRKGKVVIPAFAVGRTQNIVYYLSELVKENALPQIPVFVDSPLAISATEVFKKHPECFDRETLSRLGENGGPLRFPGLKYTSSVEESRAINDVNEPCVIISASGMCESGRILHHLRHTVNERRNTICIVGHQAENTLGRRIVEKRRDIRIFGELYPLNAFVETIEGFSAHADWREMLEFYEPLKKRLGNVFLVHGDSERCVTFAQKLEEAGYKNVVVSEEGVPYEI